MNTVPDKAAIRIADTSLNLTLANRITIGRILAIPLFILLLIYYNQSAAKGQSNELLRWAAAAVFCAAAILDAVDGYIAKSRNQITRLGTVLDPLADKALLLSGLILLGRPSVASFHAHLPVWFVLVVISREIVLLLGSAVVHYVTGTLAVKPRICGKVTTLLQIIVLAWVLCGFSATPLVWLVYGAAAGTLISGIQYMVDGLRQLET